LLTCSRQFAALKRLKRLGIATGETTFDFAQIKRHQQQMISVSALGVQKTLREAGVDLKSGTGRVIAQGKVEWTSPEGIVSLLNTENIVIAWGSEPLIPPGITPSERILSSNSFLALNNLPDSVIIIGGSVIGVEFATFLAELGVRVTIMEILERLLPHEDEETTFLLTQELVRLGITIVTSIRIETLEETADGVCLKGEHESKQLDLSADYALLCTGRKPLLHHDELDRCGIRYEKGGIIVNETLMTNVDGVYAVGDVTGGVMLAHNASGQGRFLANHLYGDRSILYHEDAIPSVVYSHPAVARVGLTEKQASEQGLKIEIRKVEFAANIMARTELKGNGFIKAVFHEDRLVGVTIVGDDAGELIAPMGLAVANLLGKKELKKWVLPHPTLSEIFQSLI
jgi:dihydrolipoamide dehydrogenase